MAGLNWVDWLIIVTVFLSMGFGLYRGFIKEVLAVLVWLLSFYIAICFYPDLMVLFDKIVDSPSIQIVCSFGVLFVISMFLFGAAKHMISKAGDSAILTYPNRALGFVFGFIRAVIILVVLVILSELVPVNQESWWRQSMIIPHLVKIAVAVDRFIPAEIQDYLD